MKIIHLSAMDWLQHILLPTSQSVRRKVWMIHNSKDKSSGCGWWSSRAAWAGQASWGWDPTGIWMIYFDQMGFEHRELGPSSAWRFTLCSHQSFQVWFRTCFKIVLFWFKRFVPSFPGPDCPMTVDAERLLGATVQVSIGQLHPFIYHATLKYFIFIFQGKIKKAGCKIMVK